MRSTRTTRSRRCTAPPGQAFVCIEPDDGATNAARGLASVDGRGRDDCLSASFTIAVARPERPPACNDRRSG